MSGAVYAHSARTLLHIAPYLRSRAVSPLEIFRRSGVSPSTLLDADGWVPRDLCFRLGNEMYAATGERFPGAAVGALFKLTELGPWGEAVSGAATLRQACEAAVGGITILHQGSDLRLHMNGSRAILSFSFDGRSDVDPRQHILGALAVLHRVALLAGVPGAVGANFSLPYVPAGDRLEETFGPSLEFGCDCDAIVIDRAILDLPVLAPNGASNDVDPLATVATLGVYVKQALWHQNICLESVARHLRMSKRTLQRRLQDWGFSFEEIVDDVRRVEATSKVVAGDSTVMEISFMLGYSDPAHFTRAFRRWTGMTPRDYAQSRRDGGNLYSIASGRR